MRLLARFWDELAAQAWEELCRKLIPRLAGTTPGQQPGFWGPAARWWEGTAPEWDLVSESLEGANLLLGEAKWSAKPFGPRALQRARRELAAKPAPHLPVRYAGQAPMRVLFVPQVEPGVDHARTDDTEPLVMTANDLLL